MNYQVVGFITRREKVKNRRINGLPVFYLESDNINWFLSKYEVSAILFPNYKTVQEERSFINACLEMGLSLQVFPPLEEVNRDSKGKIQMKPIQYEDLLNRDEITMDLSRITGYIQQKNILITGAAGTIGKAFVKQLIPFEPQKLILLDMAETPLHNLQVELQKQFPSASIEAVIGDTRNISRLNYVFKAFSPEIVFHAAFYKRIPVLEENPCEAIMSNVVGTKNLCEAAITNGVKDFVLISSDKACSPANVMGASLRLAELYLLALARKLQEEKKSSNLFITRVNNLLDSSGSVVTRFKEQIKNGGPVTVSDPEAVRYFSTANETAQLILEAASLADNGCIYVFDIGKPVKIVDLAHKIIELAGYEPEVDIPVTYTGLFKGERAVEASYMEIAGPTEHDKIKKINQKGPEYDRVLEAIETLTSYSRQMQLDEIVAYLNSFLSDKKTPSILLTDEKVSVLNSVTTQSRI
jgi:FlaA1/EpsC-like NDP-sugar epimerase